MPNNLKLHDTWLVGTGNIAVDYAKVLAAQNILFTPIGRGEDSASVFTEKSGLPAVTGGLDSVLEKSVPVTAIVTVGVKELANATLTLIKKGTRRILLEKPGGIDRTEIGQVACAAKEKNAEVLIAYNRRFYSSVLAAEDIIKQDGGVTSFNFEFTEWLHLLRNKEGFGNSSNLFLANSSHVMDMAFFLGGFPKTMSCFAINEGDILDKCSARIYSGVGVSNNGALFSYQANWGSAGRWSVEVLTRNHRLIFRPLEQLHVMNVGSVLVEKMDIDDTLDIDFKPGLYREVKAFFTGEQKYRFPTIHDQYENCDIYAKMQMGCGKIVNFKCSE